MTCRVGAGEAHTGHVAAFAKPLTDVHGVEPLGGAAGGVGKGELFAVHLPGKAVGPGLIACQWQLALHGSLLGLQVGMAGVVVDT